MKHVKKEGMSYLKKKKSLTNQVKRKPSLLQGKLIVVHGAPGVGKTQLAAHFPGPHFWFATEPGYDYIPLEQQERLIELPPEADSWNRFLESLKTFPKSRTVVIDTLDGLFDIAMMGICKEQNWTHPSDSGHGKGWDMLKRGFHRGIESLGWQCREGKSTLLVICHSREEEVETQTLKYNKIICDLTGTARRVVMGIPDYVWFMGYAEGGDIEAALKSNSAERALYLGGNYRYESKCRNDKVKTQYIAPLSKDKPYQQILRVFTESIEE